MQNAIKFSHDGQKIVITAEAVGGDEVHLSVTDYGVGISDSEIDKIFHLFYEIGDTMHHHTSKESFMGGGMGVGLSIVQDIVLAHHGKVTVKSREGEGTTFTVHIPMREADHPASASST